jgi:hypothetical protein
VSDLTPRYITNAIDYADSSAGWFLEGREANFTWLRPLSLERYSAPSARQLNVSAVSPYSYCATPKLLGFAGGGDTGLETDSHPPPKATNLR